MIEIIGIMLVALAAIAMAKHGRGKRRRNFVAIPYETELALATLADATVVTTAPITFGEDIYCVSMDASYATAGFTPTEGPLAIGWAHGDLSVTEIKEAIEAAVTDPSDIIARERARRPVRKVGQFPIAGAGESFNDGKVVRTPLRFVINDAKSIKFWAFNKSGATLTTGGTIDVSGTLYGRWMI